MAFGVSTVGLPVNEPVKSYAPGTPERTSLKARLESMAKEKVRIPHFIGGREIAPATQLRKVTMPHSHQEPLAEYAWGDASTLNQAADAALKARAEWAEASWEERSAVFLKAADLLAGPWRDTLNAATMLGQSKNAYQAEIDAACELIDFLRFNVAFYRDIRALQPISSTGVKNQLEYRALEGFVLAITPFNFTAIAANLPAAPALLGNAVVWKPSDTQMLSAYHTMKLFEAAGLPPGVINLVAADGPVVSEALLSRPELAGVHFTGSTSTFRSIWKTVGVNLDRYRTYPRLVGETGGKDFVFAHASADPIAVATGLTRGAFEYQGQKCSAASRAYLPQSLWKKISEKLLDDIRSIKMGDVRDFSCFMNAVIDERSFKKVAAYQEHARSSADAKILIGGGSNASQGWFIEPTVIQASNPRYKTMEEEIFGPVLTIYVYPDAEEEKALELCAITSPYALTGAIFAQDRQAISRLSARLRDAAGNFYINDKPTGAVVGQQPFGGARASGTNDKAGSPLNLQRWLSPRTIKETFEPPIDYRYPFLAEN